MKKPVYIAKNRGNHIYNIPVMSGRDKGEITISMRNISPMPADSDGQRETRIRECIEHLLPDSCRILQIDDVTLARLPECHLHPVVLRPSVTTHPDVLP